MHLFRKKNYLGILSLGALLTQSAVAASATQGQSLEQAADDPTASLMSLQVGDWYTADYYGADNTDANSVVLRAAIPFKTGELSHIFRLTAPFITEHPVLDNGISDTTIFDLVTFNESWGRWGIGAVALLPLGGRKRGTDQWAVGPALGFTVQQNKKLLWGAFNQNVFRVSGEQSHGQKDVRQSSIQPILSYGLGQGWSTGISENQIVYDWEASRWSSLPIGMKLAKLHRFGKLPVQFNLQYEHNFVDDYGSPENTVRFTVKVLMPTLL